MIGSPCSKQQLPARSLHMLIYSPNISFFITDSDTGHGVRLSLKIPRLLVSHVTPVNNVAICLEVLPCTGLVCAAAAENVQAAFAGLVAAETAAERERARVQAAFIIAALLYHISVAHLLSIWCIHSGRPA
jgi:hypothetical protein